MSEVLVTALLAKIDELETAAKRALAGYPSDEYNMESAYLTRVWKADYHRVIAVMTREPTPEQLAARTCDPRRELVADCGPANVYPAAHMALNDPASVLRLCRAHRDLINLYTGALFTQSCHPEYEGNNGYVKAMEETLRAVARGLGVEETTDE